MNPQPNSKFKIILRLFPFIIPPVLMVACDSGIRSEVAYADVREGRGTGADRTLPGSIQKEIKRNRDLPATLSSQDIRGLQEKLIGLGYMKPTPPNGVIGANTVQAVKKFQNKENLPVTGRFTNGTVERLKEIHLAE
ncbi:MAG: peptidoglycan-binding protein [Proteobacteria bacterium]|nr:MAG: peptidoglycan-binding protein [Pseudomonadota bacterium]